MKKLIPNHGQAVLKPVDESEKTYNNIIIPDIGNSKLTQAVIIDIAPVYNFNTDTYVPNKFKIGDLVTLPPMGSQKLTLDREEFIICGVNDLLASITEE